MNRPYIGVLTKRLLFLALTAAISNLSCKRDHERLEGKGSRHEATRQEIETVLSKYKMANESYVKLMDLQDGIVTISRPFSKGRTWEGLLQGNIHESISHLNYFELHYVRLLEEKLLQIPGIKEVRWVVGPSLTHTQTHRRSPRSTYHRFVVAHLYGDTLTVVGSFSKSVANTATMDSLLQLLDGQRKQSRRLLFEASSDSVSVTTIGRLHIQFVREAGDYKISRFNKLE